ncbi:MAG TPA: gamma-glutamyltransferase, partial [Pyrinomonadaceae bacterium]
MVVIVTALLFVTRKVRKQLARAFPQPAEQAIVRTGGSVIAHQPEAREIGEAILRAGGNAFDAFVATAVAVNVMAEGTSSLAGPLGVLIYRAQDKHLMYLDADFNDPLDPSRCQTANAQKPGPGILVPGAPAGLEALSKRYGKLPFSDLLRPSIALAEDGFPISRMMAGFISKYAKLLKKTSYGRSTFFHNDKPLKAGETLRQPEVAEFLRKLAKEGSAYVYDGEWGNSFLSVVEANGGCLKDADLK